MYMVEHFITDNETGEKFYIEDLVEINYSNMDYGFYRDDTIRGRIINTENDFNILENYIILDCSTEFYSNTKSILLSKITKVAKISNPQST